ncbi:MAG: class I SAM-dependent methyltransferase [Verrucomicrobiota bacterium]
MIVQEMQVYYGQRASEYDSSMGYDDPSVIEGLHPVIRALKKIAKRKRVLELACGPCFWTGQISDDADSITATDYNETTLEQARKKELPWQRITLEQADAYDLRSISGDFDMVMAVDWFAHVPKSRIPGFLSGITQRVPEGSSIVFIDQLAVSGSFSGKFDEEGNHLQERSLAGGKRFRVIKHFFSDEEFHEWLEPHTVNISIRRFPECRRILVHAKTKHCAPDCGGTI